MMDTLEQFAAACRRILTEDPGPEGRCARSSGTS